ncbi:MAG: hypothetical protein H6623_09745 [Bdellovibrionaceae bacterium]|nr:hypothetical protein [Pseudobdellovibrionaceae bacterium]
MRGAWGKALVIGINIGLLSCHKSPSMNSNIWYPALKSEAPTADVKRFFNPPQSIKKIGAEVVENHKQFLCGAEIWHSSAKIVYDEIHHKPQFIGLKYLANPPQSFCPTIEKYQKQLPALGNRIKIKYPVLAKVPINNLKVVYVHDEGTPKVLFTFDWLDSTNELARRWFLNGRLQIVREEKISSDFHSARATAYSLGGGRLNSLSTVALRDLHDSGPLATDAVTITTQSDQQLTSNSDIFEYPSQDVRFDQVQVLYYAQVAMSQFQQRYNYTLSNPLQVVTHIGFPEKKNAMFYFRHTVNLGQGDGIKYKNILWDPTIVTHEIMHAYVDDVAALEPGSVNEAFADYFACGLLHTSKLGEVSYIPNDFVRNLDSNMPWTSQNGGTYNDSLVLSTLLWELRKTVGDKATDEFALRLLSRLPPQATLNDVREVFVSFSRELPQFDEAFTTVLKKRGWYEKE